MGFTKGQDAYVAMPTYAANDGGFIGFCNGRLMASGHDAADVVGQKLAMVPPPAPTPRIRVALRSSSTKLRWMQRPSDLIDWCKDHRRYLEEMLDMIERGNLEIWEQLPPIPRQETTADRAACLRRQIVDLDTLVSRAETTAG